MSENDSQSKKNHSVNFVSGANTIDLKALDAEAKELRDEMDNDLELQEDVLKNFKEDESDESLDKIASSISAQEKETLAQYQALAEETSEEMKDLNAQFIKEDIELEMATSSDSDEEDAVESEEMSEEDEALRAALPQIDENGNVDQEDLQSCIEALLFYSDRPVSLKKLKTMLEMPDLKDEPMLEAIEGLKAEFSKTQHGFEIAEIANGYQLRTKPSKAPLLRKLAKVQVQRLSRGAMETLTIAAYKQPCTKDEIDQVRGVDSSHFIRTLMDRGLIEVSGRSEAPGRPMIYATTDRFLELFGLMNLGALPPRKEIEAMVPQMAAEEEGAEDPRVLKMRTLVHQMKVESNHLEYSAKEDEEILKEIRDRVKSIDVTTPYLARQKELAAEGITGEEAELLLAKEFGFARQEDQADSASDSETGEAQGELLDSVNSDDTLHADARLNQARDALDQFDIED